MPNSAAEGGTATFGDSTDGGVFSYGTALFKGSTGGLHLVQPVVGGDAT
jgi:hypothetical protein